MTTLLDSTDLDQAIGMKWQKPLCLVGQWTKKQKSLETDTTVW